MVDYALSDSPGWVKRYRFAPGTSTQEKLTVVSQLINQTIQHGKRDRTVRETAIKIIKAYKVPQKNHIGEIKALHDWCKSNIRYTFDILGVETLNTPRRTLIDRAGDCDCSAMLLAAMLGSIGYESGIALVDSKGDRKISHAMCVVKLPRPKKGQPAGWIPLETTRDEKMGWWPKTISRKIIIRAGRN